MNMPEHTLIWPGQRPLTAQQQAELQPTWEAWRERARRLSASSLLQLTPEVPPITVYITPAGARSEALP